MSLSVKQYRASVRDFLRDGYGATGFRYEHGGSHTKLFFKMPGDHPFTYVLLNDRNGAGGSSAADMKLQDIRRRFGEPSYPSRNGTPHKRTLDQMTENLVNEAKTISAPRADSSFPPPLRPVGRRFTGSVKLGESTSRGGRKFPMMHVVPPTDCIAAFYADGGPQRCKVGFTKPDLWTIRRDPKGEHGELTFRGLHLKGATYLSYFGGYFGSTAATCELFPDRLEIRVITDSMNITAEPPPGRRKRKSAEPAAAEPAAAEPAAAEPAAAEPAAAEPTASTPSTLGELVEDHFALMSQVLRALRTIEGASPYRLRRVKTEKGEEWRFKAPDVILDEDKPK